MKIVLLGPPGAGKGTLANMIKERYGVLHISTGDILREEMKSDSDLGRKVKEYVDGGALVPDEVITAIIDRRLEARDVVNKGFLLDGFPRTVKQAEDLDAILLKRNQPLDHTIYMKASLAIIIMRLTGRRVCRECGALYHMKNKPPKKAGHCDLCRGTVYQRADDNEETIRTRMDVYLKNTTPIVDYYRVQNKLTTLDGDSDTHELLNEVFKILNEEKAADQDQITRRT
jgi:adenylate kinase